MDSASAKSSGPVNLAVLADNTDAIVTATATGVTPGPGNDDCTIALTEVEVVWQLPGKQVGSRFPERVPDVPPSLPVSNEFQNTGEITPGSEVIVWLQHTDDKPFDLAWEAAMLVDGQTGWPLPQIGPSTRTSASCAACCAPKATRRAATGGWRRRSTMSARPLRTAAATTRRPRSGSGAQLHDVVALRQAQRDLTLANAE